MKKYKGQILKILMINIFLLFLVIGVNISYGYQIEIKAITKEELKDLGDVDAINNPNFPEFLYKKQVSAYEDTINKYNNKVYPVRADTGWVYQEDITGETIQDNIYYADEEKHDNAYSFERYYEFFHKYQNSNYTKEYDSAAMSNYRTTRYHDTGTLCTQALPELSYMTPSKVYNVYGETGNYSGVYWQQASSKKVAGLRENFESNQDILLFHTNLYRFAVKNGVFISNNYLSKETIAEMYNKFDDMIDPLNKTMTIYQSSILRTSYLNNKGDNYYNNMDTAFKFWETTIRGSSLARSAWDRSPSTMGVRNGNIQSSSSVINYYDNTFVLPVYDIGKTVYIRHIDVTDLETIDSSTIKNANVMTFENEQAIEHHGAAGWEGPGDRWEALNNYIYPTTRGSMPHQNKYSSIYNLHSLNVDWRFGNIKYKYSNESTGQSFEALKGNNILKDYNCIGAVIGKGETLEIAEIERNSKLDAASAKLREKTNNQESYIGTDTTAAVIKNNDYTSAIVQGNEESPVIVIDFYYEKKPTEVYVRHIDVTNRTNLGYIYDDDSNVKFLQTGVGEAFKISNSKWEESIGNVKPVARDFYLKSKSLYTYQEVFEKKSGKETLRIANIRYNHSTGGSYWNLLSTNQKSVYNKYTCLGAAVGKGDSLGEAEVKRDEVLYNTVGNNKTSFVNYSQNSVTNSGDSYIDKNGIYTAEVIDKNDYNVVVIDFYYIEASPNSSGEIDSGKKVYVRHIDVTNIDKFNSVNINKAVENGNVLAGKGKAIKNGYQNISKDGIVEYGYQERYTISSNESLEVFKDPNDNYNCIGSNKIKDSAANLKAAQDKLNVKINKDSYDSWYTESQTVDSTDNADIIIIDFYYVSKHSGTALTRNKVGRLAFYTTGQSDKFSSSVNNYTSNDSEKVYDVIPSNEVLRMSVDNAYTYMLGAINIKEQTIENTYRFNYTITQPYVVKYKDWSSECEAGHTSDNKETGTCEVKVKVEQICRDTEGKPYDCSYKEECGKEWKTSFEWKTTSEADVSRIYTYQIPYKYTYYKVKNLRLYNISKIELDDEYDNKGLPLFDGKTYTAQTTETYKSGFNIGENGAIFKSSSNTETSNRYYKTLSKTLEYTYDNDDGDVDLYVLRNYATNEINNLLDDISHSDAAKIEKFNGINSAAYTPAEENLKATLYVKNDEISFKDNVKNVRIYLIGENASNVNTLNDTYNRSEQYAKRVIDLSDYTASKTTTLNSTYEYSVNDEDKIEVSTVYPKSTTKKYLPSDSKTRYGIYDNRNYFDLVNLSIPESRLNGKRYSYGKIYYTLLSGNNVLNFDVDDSKVVNGNHNWNNDTNRKAVTGATGNTFIDTEMYNDKGVPSPTTTTIIAPGTLRNVVWEYGEDNGTDADIVDIFTPISFSTKIVGNDSKDIRVDHTIINNNTNEQKQIQKNSRFTIQIDATAANSKYSGVQTSKYLSQYYIKFNFDVQDIVITDAKGTNRNYSSNSASSETWIGPIYNRDKGNSVGTVTISAYALADPNYASGVVNQEKNKYEVRAVAVNTPSTLNYDVLRGRILDVRKFITESQNVFSGTGNDNQDHQEYYEQKNIFGQSNYVANKTIETENISRVYDFKITDVKDVDWKNIFRTSTSTTTNVHSGKAYYSGIKKWNIYTTSYNDMVTRSVSEIGATKQQILPVGPYKHTTVTYTKAPKLGYKFSFDLKTTGADANKKVVIEPSFYYVKKDGTGYTDDIQLYYKNSSNRYVKIDNYNLYFVPDDGYRLTFKGTDEAYRFSSASISKNAISLGNTKKITLTSKMMEQADNTFVQIWYGEYKLPNSTIVIGKGHDGEYNVNRDRLTGGYIGVKFDIKVYEYKSSTMTDANISKVLKYSQNDKNASSNTNTSQWDYEGYLGFANPGNSANNIKISLEKGVWSLNDDMYNKIKGTVILYDTDATAASDYD